MSNQLYYKGKLISGIAKIPRLTLNDYNALTVKPEVWIRIDAPESYKKITASDVSYDSNNTVKDMLDTDKITTVDLQLFSDASKVVIYRNGKTVQVSFMGAKVKQALTQYAVIMNFLPTALSDAYCGQYIVKSSNGTSSPFFVYINPNTYAMRIDGALTTTDELYGSIVYMCQ